MSKMSLQEVWMLSMSRALSLACVLALLWSSPAAAYAEDRLQLTALISGPTGKAEFECWEMEPPFVGYPTVGRSVTGLAEVSNVSYVVLPPRSNEGVHKPPHPMYAAILPPAYAYVEACMRGIASVDCLRCETDKPTCARFFILLSGLAHVTLPGSTDELWIVEGVNGLMVAADTVGEGHITEYPSDKPTIALQVPFKEGKVPDHRVVNQGVCDPQADPMQQEHGATSSDEKLELMM